MLVLLGVVAVVFFLFNLAPGDPARNLAGENASEEVIQNLRRKMDLDLPVAKRFALYVNDISPISVHNPVTAESRIFYDDKKYAGFKLIGWSDQRSFYLKLPYLKRSFVTDKSVSETLGEVLPGTAVLALISIAFAMFIGLIMVAFYFVILRPQRKEQLERQQAVDALKKGDRVMTTGGIYGTIQELNKEEGTCILQVDKNVRLTIARSAITPIPPPKEAAASPAAAPAKT